MSEIEDYLALAEEEGFEIGHILETHTHADHLSGRGRLAEATGATIWLSPTPEVQFTGEPINDLLLASHLDSGRLPIGAKTTRSSRCAESWKPCVRKPRSRFANSKSG